MHVERITPISKLNLKLQCFSQVYDYSDAYILVKGTISIAPVPPPPANPNNNNKEVVFKN